ncbi:MAG: DUF1501 domain-containing protein [Verrucomicrobia bacterium]|nr:DUF1501 domain-containing protein [Verrucomicrobiota bacterium]
MTEPKCFDVHIKRSESDVNPSACSCHPSAQYIAEHSPQPGNLVLTRRDFLRRTGMGMGALSLATMLGPLLGRGSNAEAAATLSPLMPRKPHFPAKAKHIIHIFAEGGPSHVDTFDPKPMLEKYADKDLPGIQGLAFPSPFKFTKRGRSGIEVSELFPKLGECVDDMAIIRSMWTDIPAHEIAQRFMNTGSLQLPKPSVGSWVVYGLGTDNQNLPGFITLGGKPDWRQSNFLPGVFQGCNVNYTSTMSLDQVLLNIKNHFIPQDRQQKQIELAERLNTLHAAKLHHDVQLESRIQAFEMAFKMQTEATDAFDIKKEPGNIRQLYGYSEMGAKLLVARRLVERGVRFVQVTHTGWDHHQKLEDNITRKAGEVDQPAAALIADLKQRGLLDETLILWGGEFGRTVVRDRNGNSDPGRDHNGRGFCCWMAGGGVKGGTVHGATDEFGARAAENRVHVHDLHATIMALLGFDHTKLRHRYNGRDFRLTDNFGNVVKDIIA